MTDTEVRNLQAQIDALKRGIVFLSSLIGAAAGLASVTYGGWYALIPTVIFLYLCGRHLDDILLPERGLQRAFNWADRRARWAAWNARHSVLSALWTLLLAVLIVVGAAISFVSYFH